MINEYAVDPCVVFQSRQTFYRFISDFGAENGRVIGAVPRKWQDRFFIGVNSLGLTVLAKRKAKDAVRKLCDTSLIERRTDDRIADDQWLAKVLLLHAECNFSGILSNCLDAENLVFNYDDMLENEPPNWILDHTVSVPRKSAELTSAISFALSVATAPVHFIDPYFDSRSDNYLLPLRSFIGVISTGRFGVKKIYVHTQLKDSGGSPRTRDELQRGFDERLAGVLPRNFSVELWIWPCHKFHDRYVLTKQVGYSFGHGLSEDNYQSAINVNVHRLSENVRKNLFVQFSRQSEIIGDPLIVQSYNRDD